MRTFPRILDGFDLMKRAILRAIDRLGYEVRKKPAAEIKMPPRSPIVMPPSYFEKADTPIKRTNKELLDQWRGRDYRPNNLFVQLTDVCNLSCAMCPHSLASKTNAYMTEEVYAKILDRAEERGIPFLMFASAYGEALLHPLALRYIRQAKARGFGVGVSTNGNYLKEEQIEAIALSGLDSIQYSFYGHDAPSYRKTYIGGDFDTASKNLKLLKDALSGYKVKTRFTVNGVDLSKDEVARQKVIQHLHGIGIEDHEILIVYATNFAGMKNAGKHKNSLNIKSNRKVNEEAFHLCTTIFSDIGVLVDGRVTACGCYDNNGSLVFGDVFSKSFREIVCGDEYRDFIEAFLRGDLHDYAMCAKCDNPYCDPKTGARILEIA